MQRYLSPHLTTHRKQQTKQVLDPPPVPPIKRTSRLSPQQEHVVQLHRAERAARYEQVLALRKQGLSHQAIADRVGVGHSTVQRWIAAGTFPERKRREQASQLDPYLAVIRDQWALGRHNAESIYRTLLTKGYRGSYGSVYTLIARWRQRDHYSSIPAETLVSSKQATWLFLRRPEDLTAKEQDTVIKLRQLHPEVDLAYELVQQFAQMLRTRRAEQLENWLEEVAKSPLTALHAFVLGISQNQAAVQAGLTSPWSQGQIEGQITRLKLIKRQGYGRVGFDLLRKRVLHAA